MLLTIIHFRSSSILVVGRNTQIGNKSRDTFSPKKVKVHVCFGNTKNTIFFKDVNVVCCIELLDTGLKTDLGRPSQYLAIETDHLTFLCD